MGTNCLRQKRFENAEQFHLTSCENETKKHDIRMPVVQQAHNQLTHERVHNVQKYFFLFITFASFGMLNLLEHYTMPCRL